MRGRPSISLLLALLVAACGASPSPTSQPIPSGPASRPPSSGDTAIPSGSLPPTRVPARSQLPCADLNAAWDQTRVALDVLNGLPDDEAWAAALAPDSPVKLDPEALDRSIDKLAGLPGQSDTIQVMRQVIPLYRAAVKSGHPFSESSGLGLRLLQAAGDASSLAKVEIPTVLDVLGCAGV